jgi:hypothetical protein
MMTHAARIRLPRAIPCVVAAITVCTAPLVVGAQDAPPSAWARAHDVNGASSSGTASWSGAWSPLRPITDIARGLLRAPFAPGVLDAPAPMGGAFVLAGSPAALARDLKPHLPGDTASFGELRVRRASESGAYRRPLDIAESDVSGVTGFGWSPVGKRGIAIGRFVIDNEDAAVSSYAERVSSYWSSPFVATDSVAPPMQRTRARLEGALGLRVGEFGVGLSVGLDTREHNSVDFPLRRTGRAATPAAMLGVERTLPWLAMRLGGFYRWSEPNETNVLNATPAATIIYGVQGYDEPFGYIVGASSPVFVRVDKRATALGGTMDLTVADTRIVATYERGDRAEDQYRNIGQRVRPSEQWRASGSSSHVQLQRLLGTRVRATVVASNDALNGTARRSDLTGIAVVGRDEKLAVEGDVRVRLSDAWTIAALGGATRLQTSRTDYVVTLSSDIKTTTPFVGGEVARRWRRVAIALGASRASTTPSGALPKATQGPTYRRLIAPSLAYDAAQASAVAGWITATLPLRSGTLITSVRSERATPSTVVSSRLQPGGERSGWSLSLGIRP